MKSMMEKFRVKRMTATWKNLRTDMHHTDREYDSLYSFVGRVGVSNGSPRWLPTWDPMEWVIEDPRRLPYEIDGYIGVAKHKRFENVLLISQNFLSEDFFNPRKNAQLGRIYADLHDPNTAGSYKLSGTNKTMGYKALNKLFLMWKLHILL